MASIKNLKKEINNVLSEIIEDCYVCQLSGDDKAATKAEKIIDEAISTFDELIAKLHEKGVENQKEHLKSLRKSFNKKSEALVAKVEKLTA